jgi:hypothetical protein
VPQAPRSHTSRDDNPPVRRDARPQAYEDKHGRIVTGLPRNRTGAPVYAQGTGWKGGSMELCHEAVNHDESLVHEWRVTQLKRLGIPGPLAEAEADNVDWHQIARLAQRGCSPTLALRIVR